MAPLLRRDLASILAGSTPAWPGMESAATRRRLVTKVEVTLRFLEVRSKNVWRGVEAGA